MMGFPNMRPFVARERPHVLGKLRGGGRTMNSSRVLRSRLLVAMGLGALSTGSALGCGGETSSPDGGSTGGAQAQRAVAPPLQQAALNPAEPLEQAGVRAAESGSGGASGAPHAGAGNAGGGAGGTGGVLSGGSGGVVASDGGPLATGGLMTIRRPFLVGASMRSSQVAERDDWLASLAPVEVTDATTRALLAEVWLKDGLEEHASVAAFARFTLLLLSVGAPRQSRRRIPARVTRRNSTRSRLLCARASLRRDQRRSGVARRCRQYRCSLARGDSGAYRRGRLCRRDARRAHGGRTTRARKGSRGETHHGSNRARRSATRRARVEVSCLGTSIRRRKRRGRCAASIPKYPVEDVQRMPVVDYGVDVPAWHAHGRMTCAEARELSRNGVERVILPCLEALIRSRAHEHRTADEEIEAIVT